MLERRHVQGRRGRNRRAHCRRYRTQADRNNLGLIWAGEVGHLERFRDHRICGVVGCLDQRQQEPHPGTVRGNLERGFDVSLRVLRPSLAWISAPVQQPPKRDRPADPIEMARNRRPAPSRKVARRLEKDCLPKERARALGAEIQRPDLLARRRRQIWRTAMREVETSKCRSSRPLLLSEV